MYFINDLAEFARTKGAKDKRKRIIRNTLIGVGGAALLGASLYAATRGKGGSVGGSSLEASAASSAPTKTVNITKAVNNSSKLDKELEYLAKASVNKKAKNTELVKKRLAKLDQEYQNLTNINSPTFDLDFRHKAIKNAPHTFNDQPSETLKAYKGQTSEARRRVRQKLGQVKGTADLDKLVKSRKASTELEFPLHYLSQKRQAGQQYKITAQQLRKTNSYFNQAANTIEFARKRGSRDKRKRQQKMSRLGAALRLGTATTVGAGMGATIALPATINYGGKALATGATIGAGILGGAAYLDHRNSHYSPVGKKKWKPFTANHPMRKLLFQDMSRIDSRQ